MRETKGGSRSPLRLIGGSERARRVIGDFWKRPERTATLAHMVFGSYAHGNATEDSDVDLLVIMNHDKPRNVD